MLTADDGRTDGQLTNYLYAPDTWRRHDPQLFDCLRKLLVSDATRAVSLVQDEQIIPGAKYFNQLLTDPVASRQAYFKHLYSQLTDIDLIFFDPDNGIEVKSKPMGGKGSSKYIYWSELLDAFNSGLTILIYQHFPRRERSYFIEQIKSEIQMRLGVDVVHWFHTPQVVYFLVPQEQHIERVHMSIKKIVENWSIRCQILVG